MWRPATKASDCAGTSLSNAARPRTIDGVVACRNPRPPGSLGFWKTGGVVEAEDALHVKERLRNGIGLGDEIDAVALVVAERIEDWVRARMIVGWIAAKIRVTNGSASACASRRAQSSSSSTACAGAALSARSRR